MVTVLLFDVQERCGRNNTDLQMSPWMETNGSYLIALLRVNLLGQSTIVEIDRGI